LAARAHGVALLADPTLPVGLLIIGAAGVISVLLPYAAENSPVRIRGRATGWVAACSKAGGLICQSLSAMAAVPGVGVAAIAIAIPTLASFGLIAFYGRETRGRELRALEATAP